MEHSNEFQELLSFLLHDNNKIKQVALQGFVKYCKSPPYLQYFMSLQDKKYESAHLKHLCHLSISTKEDPQIQILSLASLITIYSVLEQTKMKNDFDAFLKILLEKENIIAKLSNALLYLLEKQKDKNLNLALPMKNQLIQQIEFLLMFLSNLTNQEKGAKIFFLSNQTNLQVFFSEFLSLSESIGKSNEKDESNLKNMYFLTSIITNITQLDIAREWLLTQENVDKYFPKILSVITRSRNNQSFEVMIKNTLLGLLKNCLFEKQNHTVLISNQDYGIVDIIMVQLLREDNAIAVRLVASECLILLSGSKDGIKKLRETLPPCSPHSHKDHTNHQITTSELHGEAQNQEETSPPNYKYLTKLEKILNESEMDKDLKQNIQTVVSNIHKTMFSNIPEGAVIKIDNENQEITIVSSNAKEITTKKDTNVDEIDN